MSKKETALERIERLKREQAAAAAKEDTTAVPDMVDHLTHEADGKPDFAELAKKLEERKAKEAKGENFGYVKMTIYIEENLANSFNALITKRGQQKIFANEAIADFVLKKSKELDL